MLEWVALKGGSVRTWANERKEGGRYKASASEDAEKSGWKRGLQRGEKTVAADNFTPDLDRYLKAKAKALSLQ
jgi:hypothetical protein